MPSSPDIAPAQKTCTVCGNIATRVEGVCLHCAAQLVEDTHSGVSAAMDSAAAESRPVLDGWEVLNPLAIGGMGHLWLVRRASGEMENAVAKLAAPRVGNAAELRLETEAEVLGALDHPHILRLLDIVPAADGRLAMIVEYVSGCDLRRLLRAEKLSPEHAMDIFNKLCAALRHAHERGHPRHPPPASGSHPPPHPAPSVTPSTSDAVNTPSLLVLVTATGTSTAPPAAPATRLSNIRENRARRSPTAQRRHWLRVKAAPSGESAGFS